MYRIGLLLVITPLLMGQGVVESAILTGNSAAAAGKAGSAAGSGLTKTLGSVAGALGKATATATPAPPGVSAKGALPKADVVRAEEKKDLPDLALLKVGMSRQDLERIAGKPSQLMSLPEDGKLIERYKYMAGGKELRLVLEDGRVTEIKP